MAWKNLTLNIIAVNCMSWWIAKKYGWKFEWIYQVVGLVGMLSLGWLSHELVMIVNALLPLKIFTQGFICLIIYLTMVGFFIWVFPWLTGFSRADIKTMIYQALKYFRITC